MNRGTRLGTAVLAGLALVCVVNLPARADDRPAAKGASAAASASAQAKALWLATARIYKSAAANREIAMKTINDAFTKSVKRAKKELSEALGKATTPALKSAATARFKDAIDKATAVRKAALDTLPKLPQAPGPQPFGK